MPDSRSHSHPIPRSLAVLVTVGLLLTALVTGDSRPAHATVTPAASAAGPTLTAGQSLQAGQTLQSRSGRYVLAMQRDGNAVVYADGSRVLWASRTVGSAGARLVVQGDGNVVIYSSSGRAVWNTRTFGSGPVLSMQDDGNLVLRIGSTPRWATGMDPGPAEISSGTTLHAGQQLRSGNSGYRLVMQSDGNLVAYSAAGARWSSRTAGDPGSRAVLQGDGNLVVYSGARALWSSGTAGNGRSRLVVQGDGHLVLYRADGRTSWHRWLRFTSGVRPLTAGEQATMTGVTWRPGCPTPLSQLRRVELVHWDFDGEPRQGALVVRADAANDVVAVFGRLYDSGYPIRRMVPIEAYGGDDDASMAADNTSAFNCRNAVGTSSWSRHAYGLAIDINPVENPYIRGGTVLPPAGKAYVDRNQRHPAILTSASVAVTQFEARGWQWGGRWTSLKDYQHVEKPR